MVSKLLECYVSNKLLYRCLLCCEILQKTKKTFSFKKLTLAERRYSRFWKNNTNSFGSIQDTEKKEMAIKSATMGGIKIPTIYFPKGKAASTQYPCFVVFEVMSPIRKSTFNGTNDDGVAYSRENESIEINTNIFWKNNNKAISGIVRLSDEQVIASLRREFKGGAAVGAIGFYFVDEVKPDGTPVISSFWSYSEAGEKKSRTQLLIDGYKHLNDNDVLVGIKSKLKEVGITVDITEWGLISVGRFFDDLLLKYKEKGGELIFSSEPVFGTDQIPF